MSYHLTLPSPLQKEAASQTYSEPQNNKVYVTLDNAQLRALCKAIGDAQSGKRETLDQRLREHDTRALTAGDEQRSEISRSSVSIYDMA